MAADLMCFLGEWMKNQVNLVILPKTGMEISLEFQFHFLSERYNYYFLFRISTNETMSYNITRYVFGALLIKGALQQDKHGQTQDSFMYE